MRRLETQHEALFGDQWASMKLAKTRSEIDAGRTSLPNERVRRPIPPYAKRALWLAIGGIVALLAFIALTLTTRAHALEAGQTERIEPRAVYVTDGDTIRVGGFAYRLVNFDAPEIGRTARCEREIEKGYEAKAALVDLVNSGRPLSLERVACSCAPSSPEGSLYCNYGRRCGTLRVAGDDVGAILIRDGFAKAYSRAAAADVLRLIPTGLHKQYKN